MVRSIFTYLGIVKDPEEGEMGMGDGVHILPPGAKSCHNPDEPYKTRSAQDYGKNIAETVMGDLRP